MNLYWCHNFLTGNDNVLDFYCVAGMKLYLVEKKVNFLHCCIAVHDMILPDDFRNVPGMKFECAKYFLTVFPNHSSSPKSIIP